MKILFIFKDFIIKVIESYNIKHTINSVQFLVHDLWFRTQI